MHTNNFLHRLPRSAKTGEFSRFRFVSLFILPVFGTHDETNYFCLMWDPPTCTFSRYVPTPRSLSRMRLFCHCMWVSSLSYLLSMSTELLCASEYLSAFHLTHVPRSPSNPLISLPIFSLLSRSCAIAASGSPGHSEIEKKLLQLFLRKNGVSTERTGCKWAWRICFLWWAYYTVICTA